MKKYPFSDAGFQAMQKDLYALTDQELQVVANAVANHFNSWMSENFDLTESQIAFIEGQQPQMTAFLSTQTSFAMVNRLPITLIKPESKINALMRGAKLIRPKVKAEMIPDGGPYHASGNLDIEITY
ncbi:hypothetical protein [Pedobacter namyangjuensis]|uniref:hypothetical protein n=1 Tax=Pedobacter namyangjuensis TaxID=600626 RepID=UPI000DE3BB64|nr:hypothetical protein [Pedobacter namyangjuensis]